MPTSTSTEETALRARVETLAQAIRDKNVAAVMAHYSPDIVTFDVRPPLKVQGDEYRKNFERWFSAMQGPIDYETQDLRIVVSSDVAFCYSVSHVKGTWASGKNADYWVRVTTGFQKMNGQWLVTHEHVSMPAQM
jgi:ketosteroid isomerase-like protein